MSIIRIYLLDRPDEANSYEEWKWRLEENYQFKDTEEDRLAKKRVEKYGYFFGGDKGFVKNFKYTMDSEHPESIKMLSKDNLPPCIRIYKYLSAEKKRDKSIKKLLD